MSPVEPCHTFADVFKGLSFELFSAYTISRQQHCRLLLHHGKPRTDSNQITVDVLAPEQQKLEGTHECQQPKVVSKNHIYKGTKTVLLCKVLLQTCDALAHTTGLRSPHCAGCSLEICAYFCTISGDDQLALPVFRGSEPDATSPP